MKKAAMASECAQKYMIEAEFRKNMKDHLRIGIGIIPFPKLNQTSNFRAKAKECTQKYMTEAATREIAKDHLRIGIGINGFSFVEISIIITVIGILIGGLFAASSMIRNSQMQKVASELAMYEEAIVSFKDKYLQFPGDMTNATTYWPSPVSTRNGNGNGQIETCACDAEDLAAFEHLSLAGLINGSFNGDYDSIKGHVPGANVPASILTGGAYWMLYGTIYSFSQNYISLASLGANGSGNQKQLTQGVINAHETEQLDKKIDDGKPDLGKILGVTHAGIASDDCTEIVASERIYKKRVETKSCRVVLLLN